jgi:CheY-like chemotaxis protein
MSKRILVVEDQADNRQIIRDMLAASDYQITEAENGQEALAEGKSGNPGGRPRQLASVMHEARRHTLEALQVQLQLMQSAESESVRLNAAEAILNRAWGRPIQALQVDGRFLTKKLTDLTTEEIRDLEQRVEMIEPDQGVLALTDETESPQPRNIEP